jgi:DNA-binding CsgD family transcriptional regulator
MTDGVKQGALIGAIYEAGLEPGKWPDVLSAVRHAVGGEASLLLHRDATLPMRHCEMAAMSGWTAGHAVAYNQYYGSLDVRVPHASLIPVGQVYVDDRQIPFATVAKSEIFCDFFRPAGLGYGMAANLFSGGGRYSFISVHHALGRGNFPAKSIALFEILVPHIVRSLQIQRQMQRADELVRGLALVLEHFSLAVVLVTGNATVRQMNSTAAEMVRDPRCPLQVLADHLVGRDPGATERLRRQIGRAAALAHGRDAPATEILSLRRRDGIGALSVMVAPLRGGAFAAEPLVAVFVSDPSQTAPLDTQLLMQQFGLTPAEAALAAELAQGANLSEIADARRVSIETARTLLKRAMAKTESRSQGQLIGLLGRSLAVLQRR